MVRKILAVSHRGPVSKALLFLGVAFVPVLGGIGWKLSPGRDAFLGALAYWPLLLLGVIFSMAMGVVLYAMRSVHPVVQIIPGAVTGCALLVTFLTLDYRHERAELVTKAGIKGIIYEDTSGEFGVDFIFSVVGPDGDMIGEKFLGFAMAAHERQYFLREIKGSIEVHEGSDPGQVIAWYSPASNRVLSY